MKKNFVDFQNFVDRGKFVENFIIHETFLESREVHNNFRPDRFSRFDVYLMQMDRQAKYIY